MAWITEIDNIALVPPGAHEPENAVPALQARGVATHYGRKAVLEGLDLALPSRTVTALCGPNGCGKSTLLRVLCGLQPLVAGEVQLDGAPLSGFDRRAVARRVAFLPQQPVVPEGLTVREVVSLGRFPHRSRLGGLGSGDRRAVDRALEYAEVVAFAGRRIEALSGGERQRVWLALTLAQEASILLLDEPTTFLDPQHQIGTLGRIRTLAEELELTVVWVLHDLNHAAAYSDRLVLMRDGSVIAQGTPERVLTETLIRRVFGLDTLILSHPQTGKPLCVPQA